MSSISSYSNNPYNANQPPTPKRPNGEPGLVEGGISGLSRMSGVGFPGAGSASEASSTSLYADYVSGCSGMYGFTYNNETGSVEGTHWWGDNGESTHTDSSGNKTHYDGHGGYTNTYANGDQDVVNADGSWRHYDKATGKWTDYPAPKTGK